MGVLAHLAIQRRSLGREIQNLANDGIRLDETEEGDSLRKAIMEEAHSSRYSIHLGATKMYLDLKELYWWKGMKKQVGDYVAKCLNCQQVKAEHQRPGGLAQDIKIPQWKWEMIYMDFDNISMAPYEALYGRRCRSPVGWFEPAEVPLIGPEFACEALEKVQLIKERLKSAQSRQKSYSDKRHRDLEFMVGDKVFLKVSPMKGVMRFGKKGKLSPRFIGPYEILEKKGNMAYKLALPVELSFVHPVFYMSMLRKYIHDESHIISADTIEIKEGLTYEEVPIKILNRQVRKLRTKDLASVRVLWSNHDSKEATWEVEEDMRKKYPYLFEEKGM
ncbi:uncharacterized protein [Nicotiana sylvestris]|uniref:uncharacterized protein n=1 Tax=Nicotiana sylvestris TaxID=4096 RepID=UPI00388CEBF9